MARFNGTSAADALVDDARDHGKAIETEAFDLAIDAVGGCTRYDVSEESMVASAYGQYVDVNEAQDAIRDYQR